MLLFTHTHTHKKKLVQASAIFVCFKKNIFLRTHSCAHTHEQTYTHTHTHTHDGAYPYAKTLRCTITRRKTPLPTRIYTHAQTHNAYTYIQTYKNAGIHTHTHVSESSETKVK